MTQQAFVIDQGRCIGCHAWTVACKVEHGVELGDLVRAGQSVPLS